jgi:hypothetical protein
VKASGNYERESEDQKIYTIYQKLRIVSGEAMLKHKQGEESLDFFKHHLNRFLEQYRTKWDKTEKVQKPDFMEDRRFVDDLSVEECRELHYKLVELAEELGDLGHTKEKWEEETI